MSSAGKDAGYENDMSPDAQACERCGVRRDEHADQSKGGPFSALDITDHSYVLPPETRNDG